jgi:hypothetical protein
MRLVQIDTPEVYFGTECYGLEASTLSERLPPWDTSTPGGGVGNGSRRSGLTSACGGRAQEPSTTLLEPWTRAADEEEFGNTCGGSFRTRGVVRILEGD